jgi:hypothetical protein
MAAALSISIKPVEPVSTATQAVRLMPSPRRAAILNRVMVYTLEEGRSDFYGRGARPGTANTDFSKDRNA